MSPRGVVTVLLTGAATLIAGAVVPALPAAASPAQAGFIYVQQGDQMSPTSNVGLLSVTIASSTPLTSMTVSLFQPVSGGKDELDLPMSDFTVPTGQGDGTYHTWTLTNPITTGQLAIGSYSVEVTAADMGGDTIPDTFAGTLGFLNVVSVPDFKSNGTTFSQDNPNVTFTGTAMVLPPGGPATPFGNKTLELTDNSSDMTAVPTASDGMFSVTIPAKPEFFWLEYNADPQYEGGSASIQIFVTTFPAHVTAKVKVTHTKYGQPDSVSGTATYTDTIQHVTKPLAGNKVSLYINAAVGGQIVVATTVTNAKGQYTMPATTKEGDVTFYVSTTPTTFLPLATSAGVPITVAYPNSFSRFKASVNAFALVTVSGCMRFDARPLRIEYAANPHGPWFVLGRITEGSFTSCGTNNWGFVYSGAFYARLASAYYRAHYTGSYDVQPAISKTVHLARLLTKITSFQVSPRHTSVNGSITVSGRLWKQLRSGSGKFGPYGHRRVIVVFRYQGVWYRYPGEPKTNAAGRFKGTFKLYATTPMFAQYNGDAAHFASASKRIKVTASGAAVALNPLSSGASIWRAPRLAVP